MCSTRKISNVFTYFMGPWKKSHIISRDARICVMVPFQFNNSCDHIMYDFTGTRKQTSLEINKQLNERFLIHGVLLSLWKTKNTTHYVSTVFCNVVVGLKIVIFVKLWRVRKPGFFFFRLFHFLNSIWLIFFCSRNGTCCYLHKWDTEQGKCIRK